MCKALILAILELLRGGPVSTKSLKGAAPLVALQCFCVIQKPFGTDL